MEVREDRKRGELVDTLGSRELETLRLMSSGYVYREVAEVMGISPQTVKNCLAVVRGKLNARTTAHAVAIAKDRGLI